MTGRKVLLRLMFGVVALLVLLGGAVTAALYSETVFREALRIAQPMIPGELQYEEISGTLNGPIHAVNARYEIAGTRIRVARLSFDPSPFALLSGRVSLGDVAAEQLEIRLPPAGDDDDAGEPMTPRDILDALRLPVGIAARSLDVRGATLIDGNGRTLLALDRLALQLEWTDKAMAVTGLDASGDGIAARGDLALGLAAGQASRIDIDGQWNGLPFPLAGSLRGEGDAESLHLAAQLSAPADIELDAQLQDLLDTPRWQGTLAFRKIAPAHFKDGLPDDTWSGDVEFRGAWRDTRFRAQAHGSWPPANDADLQLEGRVNSKRLSIPSLLVNVGAFGTRMTASGRVDYEDALLYSAEGAFDAFAWPGQEPFTIRDARFETAGDGERVDVTLRGNAGENGNGRFSARGVFMFDTQQFNAELDGEQLQFDVDGHGFSIATVHAKAEGRPEDYRLHAELSGNYAELPIANIQASLRGNPTGLNANIERLQWLEGQASANVALDWQEHLQLDADVNGQGFRLEEIFPELAATLGGRVSVNGNFSGEHPDLRFRIASISGDIEGRRLQGRGDLRLAGNRFSTSGLTVNAGDAELRLRNGASDRFDFEMNVPDMQALYPPLKGSVRARGSFGGSLQQANAIVTANGSNLAWEGFAAGNFSLDAEIADGGESESRLDLDVHELLAPSFAADRLRLGLRGSSAQHELELRLDNRSDEDDVSDLQIALGGSLDENGWRGRIARLLARHSGLGDWALAEEHAGQVIEIGADGRVNVPEHCLRGPVGAACIGPFRHDDEQWHAAVSLQQLPVELFAMWLPIGLDYRGELNGKADITGNAQGIQGDAELRLGAGSIRQGAAEDAIALLAWTQGRVRVDFAGRQARGELNIALEDGGGISGQGELQVPESGSMTIDARLRAQTDDLGLLPSLVPELSRLHGRLEADLRVTGPLETPRVRGEARMLDGSARILALGTDWRNVNLTLVGEGRQLSLTGRAEAGDGHIDIEMQGRDTGEGFAGEASLRGDNFKAMQTPEADVNISPNLSIRLDGRNLHVGGEVVVPYARITPRDLSLATQPSGDQVIVDVEERAREQGLQVHVRVTTRLGDDVRVNAFGLDARLEGQLTVQQSPDSPTTGNGRLSVAEGQYRAYGQDLNLERGYVIYTGQQIGNPGLDIRATRTPRPDLTVGVTVRGPLAQPRVSVFSEPAMAETEALSYLLFGRSLSEATGDQASEVNATALALGIGGQRLLGRVGERLGVEEVRLEQAGNEQEASLVLGKYLSPDLYVSYGIGLYDAVNTFRIRYRLSSKWTMEATSGLKSSADFVYTIER